MTNNKPCIAALDVGGRRIGVALARRDVGLASAHSTLINDESIWDQLQDLVTKEEVGLLVLGLPRGMNGQETEQTRTVQAFGTEVEQRIGLPIFWQDEAATSIQAEEELKASGKRYNKEMIDAQAAAIILQDYLDSHKETV